MVRTDEEIKNAQAHRDRFNKLIVVHKEFLALPDYDDYLTKPDKNIKWEQKLKKKIKNVELLELIEEYLKYKKIGTEKDATSKGWSTLHPDPLMNSPNQERLQEQNVDLPLPRVNTDNEKIERFKKQRDSMEEKLKT